MNYIDYTRNQKKKKKRIKMGLAIIMLTAALLIAVKLLSGENGGIVSDSSVSDFFSEGVTSGAHPDAPSDGDASVSRSESDTPTVSTSGKASTTKENDKTTDKFAGKTTSNTTVKSTTKSANTEENTYEYAYAGFDPQLADVNISEWNLLLVNRDYILPDGYSADLAEAAPGTGVNLDSRVAPHYAEMYAAAKADGITLTPLSGHRRISTQKTNFENKISKYINQGYSRAEATQLAAKIILPPGTSEHNAGLAMDICSLEKSFENSNEFVWLTKHAADYGFILRYPEDKTDVTKITYEPWHWRYVGEKHAKKIKSMGVCLEEYLGKS